MILGQPLTYWLLVILAAALLLAPPIIAWLERRQNQKDKLFYASLFGSASAKSGRVRGGNSRG